MITNFTNHLNQGLTFGQAIQQNTFGTAFYVLIGAGTLKMQPYSALPVWVEDNLPGNATESNGENEPFNWVTTPVYSGTKAHQSSSAPAGVTHQHFFDNSFQNPMVVNTGSELYTYVYLDPANPPTEVMLQWNYGGNWTRVYWGANNIDWNPRIRVGDLPPVGVWTRLSVPARTVPITGISTGLENKSIYGMAFTLSGGKATWDCSGVVNPVTNIWIEDNLPGNATESSGESEPFNWVTTPVYSGIKAHQSSSASAGVIHQHFFDNNYQNPMVVNTGSELYTYVYLDPANPPLEVMLQWNYGGNWTRVYWGANNIDWNPRIRIGDLPPVGVWTKLSVPARTVPITGSNTGLENKSIYGMAFTLSGGKATWDCSGTK